MSQLHRSCPDCESAVLSPQVAGGEAGTTRREFLRAVGSGAAAAAIASSAPGLLFAEEKSKDAKAPETLVKQLFDSLNERQRKEVCFDWDHQDPSLGLLRTRISNNWHITKPIIRSEFYTGQQQEIARAIWEGLIVPDWQKRVDKQLQDDAGGWGNQQNIALFGKPGDGKFELVMTGRHMTLRVDGNTAENVAFGGPIFYGHAASGFNEKPGHPNNVYWEQALEANKVYAMLDGKQRKAAEVAELPKEEAVGFQGEKGKFPGIAVSELSSDQKEQVQKTLQKLIEPYRQTDKEEVLSCLKSQGGLDHCSLAFYTSPDLGDDKVWDSFRLEGPSFVWFFRGTPHVHVWVNIASDANVKTNS